MPKKRVFTQEDAQVIADVVMKFIPHPQLVEQLYAALDPADYDRFSKAIVEFTVPAGITLPLIKTIVRTEFDRNASTPGSIMRGNTVASKLMSLYCKRIGLDYLQIALGDMIRNLLDSNIDLEVDNTKCEDISGEEIKKRRVQLLRTVSQFLERIASPEMVAKLPREIKALCYYVASCADEIAPNKKSLLVGGFIMLRFINPTLISPESFGLLPSGVVCPPKARRNLTLISKILQNVSNQRIFNEDFLVPLNDYVSDKLGQFTSFIDTICVDPNGLEVPFSDLTTSINPKEIDLREIDVTHLDFFSKVFTSEQEAILTGITTELPQEYQMTDVFKTFVEAFSDFPDNFPNKASSNLTLYYSPHCPFSRMIWFFCLENAIPINMCKIDLLKVDQGLDPVYKKFKALSPSLQAPLLCDNNFVLEESNAILLYLCDKFIMAQQWIQTTNLLICTKINQMLDWLADRIQSPILYLWKSVKIFATTEEKMIINDEMRAKLFANLRTLDDVYDKPRATKYLYGAEPSLVELAIVFYLSFCQIVPGFALTSFPNLHSIYTEVPKKSKQSWETVNSEYQGFARYIITGSKKDSLPRVSHTILFEETPHTIYEMILDPENDIFLFLASKTISSKSNAKVKQGLSKLKQDGKGDQEQEQKEKVPYQISLEVGGKFSIQHREGTNLLLVPGHKIVQQSRRPDWERGHISTEVFDLYKIEDSHTKLVFTQMNCPIANLTESELQWSKFWKQINGHRCNDLIQKVYFKNKTPEMLYPILTDWKQYTRATKTKVKVEEDGTFIMHNKTVVGKTLSTETNKKIVQKWRTGDWPFDHFSVCEQVLEEAPGGCTRLHFSLTDVPHEKQKNVDSLWKTHVWKKLGGIICSDLKQKTLFRVKPDEAYKLWLNQEELNTKLRTKCQVSEKEKTFSFYNGTFKGTITSLKPFEEINLLLAHKDFPSQHFSEVKLSFATAQLGTIVHLSQRNIPNRNLKSIRDSWTNDFWEKLDAVQVDDFHASIIISMPPTDIYCACLSSKKMTKLMGGGPCSINPCVGGDVALNDNSIKGKIVELVPDQIIEWTSRDFEWPYAHYSVCRYQFAEHDNGSHTLLTFSQTHVPIGKLSESQSRWEHFVKGLKNSCL